MSVKLLTVHHLEFLSIKGGSTCSSESTLVKMPHCWNDSRNYFTINLHESMGLSRDCTFDPWICSKTRICSQTRYRQSWGYERLQKSKGSLKDCFENVNITEINSSFGLFMESWTLLGLLQSEFARDPQYSWFHEQTKKWIYYLYLHLISSVEYKFSIFT